MRLKRYAGLDAGFQPIAAQARARMEEDFARSGLIGPYVEEVKRSLDNTERIAATLAQFVRFRRAYDTLDRYYGTYDALTPEDLLQAARRYLTDSRLVVTTLAYAPPDFDRTIELMAQGKLPAERVVTAEIPLQDVVELGFDELIRPLFSD